MQAKRFTRCFPQHTERHPVSSVLLNATRIALALAVASACRAQTVGTWTEFSAALPVGGEVIVTGDIAFENNLKINEPASVTGEGRTLLDGSPLTSRHPGVYATEPLSLSNLGSFTTDEVGFIQDADLQGGFRNFSGGAVVIEQYAVNQKDVLVTVADTVFDNNGGDKRQQVDGGAFLLSRKNPGVCGFATLQPPRNPPQRLLQQPSAGLRRGARRRPRERNHHSGLDLPGEFLDRLRRGRALRAHEGHRDRRHEIKPRRAGRSTSPTNLLG